MRDMRKTKAQLVAELEELRKHVAELEAGCPEGALEESEKKFRALTESTSAHISIVQNDRYIYANPAFLDYYGFDEEDLALVTPEELFTMGMASPEMMKDAEAAYRRAMERGDSHFRFEFQDGEGRWFQSDVTIMELDGKESVLMMSVDITELKRAQREMYRADKMAALGQIVAGVAHEINNPNNFIHFNLPILRRYIDAVTSLLEPRLGEEPDLRVLGMPYEAFVEDVHKLLETMELGSKRITGIVSELKAYVRSDESQDRRPAAVAPSVERVMTLVGKQVRKMVKHLDVEIADGLPLVDMNAGKVEQVLINLLINAGQAADKEDSWVKVTVRPAADNPTWVEILVEDNGAGIRPEVQERIFEPFFTSKGRDQGTGLGLSISHRIVDEHGGRIEVESTPGEGTRFTISLPASPEA